MMNIYLFCSRSLVLVLACFWCLCSALAAVPKQSQRQCIQMFQHKQYHQAAQCFLQWLEAYPSSRNLSQAEKVKKGRILRNAVLALQKAAQQQQDVQQAAFLREQAVQLLQSYLRERLYELKYRKQSAQLKMHQLREKIGYAPLTVLLGTKDKKVNLVLKGYQFRLQVQAKKSWSRKIRPGQYTLTLRLNNAGKVIVRRFQVQPGQPKVLTLSLTHSSDVKKDPKKPSARVVQRHKPPARNVLVQNKKLPAQGPGRTTGWILLGSGGAVLIGGVVTLIVAGLQDGRKASMIQSFADRTQVPTAADTQAITALHGQSQNLFAAGWTLLGVGTGAAVTGSVLLGTSR